MNDPFCIPAALILFATGTGKDGYTNLAQVYKSSVEKCSNLAPLPSSTYLATGGAVDKTPVLCGGYITSEVDGVHSITPSSKCYYHDRNLDSWILIGNMNTARAAAGSIVIDSKLWVIGGSADGLTGLDTTEFIDMKNGGKITYGPPLTKGRYGHCVVALNDNEVMIIGGHSKKTEIGNGNSRIACYHSFISQDFFHFFSFIHNGDNLNM